VLAGVDGEGRKVRKVETLLLVAGKDDGNVWFGLRYSSTQRCQGGLEASCLAPVLVEIVQWHIGAQAAGRPQVHFSGGAKQKGLWQAL
jgi:hypothetical protein